MNLSRRLISLASVRSVRCLLPWLGALAVSVASAQAPVQVPVVAAQVRSVGVGFELDGVIQPVKQSTVSAQAGGRIATLVVKAGDKVRAGQVLATIDDREAQTGVQRSPAEVAQAQAALRNAQANYDRTRDLQSKGFVSAAALDTADSQLKGASAGRDQAGAGARQAALAQGFTRVTAPFDGWVLQTHAGRARQAAAHALCAAADSCGGAGAGVARCPSADGQSGGGVDALVKRLGAVDSPGVALQRAHG